MKRKNFFIFIFSISFLGIAAVVSLLLSKNELSVTRYQIATGLAQPIRIVQLTDLHNSVFGAHNRRLIKKVAS